MSHLYANATTRKTLRIMLGNMYPSEMSDLTEDRQIQGTDIPDWVEQTLLQECKMVVARLPRYEARIQEMYGPISSLVGKITVYHTVCDNWDSMEPCNFQRMKPLRYYFDEHIDPIIKHRIQTSNPRSSIMY